MSEPTIQTANKPFIDPISVIHFRRLLIFYGFGRMIGLDRNE